LGQAKSRDRKPIFERKVNPGFFKSSITKDEEAPITIFEGKKPVDFEEK
jgi:hypothetical protein